MCKGLEGGARQKATEARKWWAEGIVADEDTEEAGRERFPIRLQNTV